MEVQNRRLCRVTTKNNPVLIYPLIVRFTQVTRWLTNEQIFACLNTGAIVELVDSDGNVIEKLNFGTVNRTVNVIKKEEIIIEKTTEDSPVIIENIEDVNVDNEELEETIVTNEPVTEVSIDESYEEPDIEFTDEDLVSDAINRENDE